MADRIRIGIVGAGNNTRSKHIPGFQKIGGVMVDVVCNRSPESSRRVADTFGIPRIAASWQEVVADPDLDAVMIGTWPCLHAPVSIAALEAGKHVLCEARMAMNVFEARDMLKASESRPECVAQIVPSPFTLKWDRFLTRMISEGKIGEVLHVDVFANCGAFMDPDRNMNWRDDVNLSGLNTMMLGIYYEAMARWLGHAAGVQARGRIQVKQRRDGSGEFRELYIPDHLDVFGELESGASYHIRCSQLTGACPTPNDFVLYGSAGTLRLNVQDGELLFFSPDGTEEKPEVPASEQECWRVEEEFVGAIRGEEPVRRTSFPEGVRYMDFTQKVADQLKLAPSGIRKPLE